MRSHSLATLSLAFLTLSPLAISQDAPTPPPSPAPGVPGLDSGPVT